MCHYSIPKNAEVRVKTHILACDPSGLSSLVRLASQQHSYLAGQVGVQLVARSTHSLSTTSHQTATLPNIHWLGL